MAHPKMVRGSFRSGALLDSALSGLAKGRLPDKLTGAGSVDSAPA
jgi:hypothetical protein